MSRESQDVDSRCELDSKRSIEVLGQQELLKIRNQYTSKFLLNLLVIAAIVAFFKIQNLSGFT